MAQKLSDEELKKKLTPEQYEVLVRKGTEPPFSGKYLDHDEAGVYKCLVCGTPIFSSDSKYESTQLGLQGWPSFGKVISDAVELKDDHSWGMHRIEVSCKTCGSHLGHVFDDNSSPTGQHYCVNSCALDFSPKDKQATKS